MNTNPLNETELAEILQIAQEGEPKLREMSDRATIIAEKWRRTQVPEQPNAKSGYNPPSQGNIVSLRACAPS
jgi:hypothetical protein